MSKAWVIVILALATIAVAAFLARSNLPGLDDPDPTRPDGAEAAPDLQTAQGTEDPASGTGADATRPTLYGRAHVRIGVGDAIGRLQDFVTKEPVVGATLRLSGTGYGGEEVAVAAESGEDGRFRLPSVPAGEDLELAVTVTAGSARTLTGLVVAAGRVEDLGTIWLGETGTLEGRVLGMDGQGIRGAEVRVFQGRFSQEMIMEDFVGFLSKLDREPVPVAKGATEAAGRFRIEGVPPGPITVAARVPNHHQAVEVAAMTKDGAVGGPIELRVAKADPIVGRVVTEDGRGLGGARVGFLNQSSEDLGFLERRFVETSPDGSFHVDAPPPARELVAIVAAEGYPTLFAEVGSDRAALEFILVGGSRITLRFVHDDTGDPIPDAAIVAMLQEETSSGGIGTFLPGLTDEQGRVELIARPGTVEMLMLQHPEYGSSVYSPQLVGFGEAAGLALKGPPGLEIRAGDNEAEFRMPRGVTVRGIVTDEAGRPVAGVTVRSSGGMFGIGKGPRTLTDEAGAFRLTAPAGKSLLILAEAPGFVQDATTRAAAIVAGAAEIEHHVVLLQAARVEGRVAGKAGAPAAGAQVRLRMVETEDSRGWDETVASAETAVADDQGRFAIEGVMPGGEYYLIGRGTGYVATSSQRFRVEKGARTVRAPLLTLERGAVVEVEVRDPYGSVVGGAHVEAKIEPANHLYWDESWQWRPYAELVTDASGQVEFRDLPDGKVTFTARAEGSAPARREVELRAAALPTSPVVVRLRSAITIRGTVFDQHGEPVMGGDVSLGQDHAPRRQPGGAESVWVPYQTTRTDRHGRFEIRGVPGGVSIRVNVGAEGYRHTSVEVQGRSDDLRLVIHKIDPEIHRRDQALEAELMALYGRYQAATDESERQALMEEIQALQEQRQALSGSAAAESRAEPAPPPQDR